MQTADTEMNTKHENYLNRSEKLRLKKLEPAWEVVLKLRRSVAYSQA